MSQADFKTKVQLGEIDRWSILEGMGEREGMGNTAAGEDIWRGNDLNPAPTSHTLIPTPPDAGEQMTLISQSVNDAAAGTGIQTVRISYLDAAGDAQTEDVTMNGTTGVNTVATDIRFVQHLHALTVGSGGSAAANIRIHKVGVVATVYSMIGDGENHSLVPHKMVPAGHILLLQVWHASEAQGKRVSIRLRSTDHDGVLLPGVFVTQDTTYIKQATTPSMALTVKVPALSIVKASGYPDAIGADVGCRWWGYLVDKR